MKKLFQQKELLVICAVILATISNFSFLLLTNNLSSKIDIFPASNVIYYTMLQTSDKLVYVNHMSHKVFW